MENNPQLRIFEAALDQRISQLARKYGNELVVKIWEKIEISGGDEAFFSVCGWKPEMNLMEALDCLQDYCDFIETNIQKHQEKANDKRLANFTSTVFH